MSEFINLPPQQLPFNRKNKAWRKRHLDWAESKTFFNYSLVRNSVLHKRINYDLLQGKLHMSDLQQIINPDQIKAGYIPEKIQHYPIINSKLNVLIGEESKRVFDYRVVVTNPNAVSEIEEAKKAEILQRLTEMVQNTQQSEEEFGGELDQMNDYYQYDWQDMREERANALLNHYWKEYNMPLIFNDGFVDALCVGEEIYQCDIVGGEPTLTRLNPCKVRVFKSGYSNRIEDADVIVIEDYWNPGRVIDTFYEVLTPKDRKYIEETPNNIDQSDTDAMGNIDERYGFIDGSQFLGDPDDGIYFDPMNDETSSLLPFDLAGNIRVIRMYWKSRRKIKKVKFYDPVTGDENFDFYPENYILDEAKGEEEEIFYINEAWEGTKIGSDIYVNMGPRAVQYNRVSNPSRCHFGIIGTVYTMNEDKPFSMVDMMKPYNYLYDAIHDRLNKMIAKNWGKIMQLDLAKIPTGWDVEKWVYFAKTNSLAIVDSFKESNRGLVAGGLNNASSGVIDAELGNSIQMNLNLLEYIKNEMADVVGISKQREGNIANRETVGGVERATLQSSYITEKIFMQHEDLKKRVMEAFLETAKIALQGRNMKFQYILSDNSTKIMDIDGDEFSECDYGLVVDNSGSAQILQQKLDGLAQAALQSQVLNFSSIMKLYNSSSLAEKQRMIEKSEKDMQQKQEQAQQQQAQMQQQQMQMQQQQAQMQMQQTDMLNQRDNETKIQVAQIQAQAKIETTAAGMFGDETAQIAKEKIAESQRQFEETMGLAKSKLDFEKTKHAEDLRLKDTISKRDVEVRKMAANKPSSSK